MERFTGVGFEGVLYPAAEKQKAMIVVTGSDGGIKAAKQIAKAFACCGVPALALAYWGTGHTSKTLSLIPVEIIKAAIALLKENGYSKIGIYGFSKGAELALTAASLLSQIELVVAVSPACCVFEGIAKPNYSGTSSFTWQGKPLPYASFKGIDVSVINNLRKNREFGFSQQYLRVLAEKKNEENTIKVENISGAILLISAEQDAQWPAADMGRMITERLKEKKPSHPVRHEIFYPASHLLCPVKTPARFVYRIERTHTKECQIAREKAWELTLEQVEKL